MAHHHSNEPALVGGPLGGGISMLQRGEDFILPGGIKVRETDAITSLRFAMQPVQSKSIAGEAIGKVAPELARKVVTHPRIPGARKLIRRDDSVERGAQRRDLFGRKQLAKRFMVRI